LCWSRACGAGAATQRSLTRTQTAEQFGSLSPTVPLAKLLFFSFLLRVRFVLEIQPTVHPTGRFFLFLFITLGSAIFPVIKRTFFGVDTPLLF
jgi:hypothetical protein